MATNSALASASTDLVDASTLLDLTLPEGTPPASTVVAPKQPTAPKGTVRIGSEDLTPEQASARLVALQSEVTQLKPLADVGSALAKLGQDYGPEAAQAVVDYALEIERNGGVPQRDETEYSLVSQIDVPASAVTPNPFKWDEVDDEIRYLYAHTEGRFEHLFGLIQDQHKIIKSLQAQLGQVSSVTAEQQLVSNLQRLGVPATLETVGKMRAAGVDPGLAMKNPAMLAWMREAHKVKKQEERKAPPEAPGSTGDNVFDLDDPNLTIPQKLQRLSEGATPISKDPEEAKRFIALAKEHGVTVAA
jgi:hypothetical protein